MKIIGYDGIVEAIFRGLFKSACITLGALGIGYIFNFPEAVLEAWALVIVLSIGGIVGLMAFCALCWFILCSLFA